jgi:hypothetical protein
MNTTADLGLKLPAQTDEYNVDDFNYNFELIDEKKATKPETGDFAAGNLAVFDENGNTVDAEQSPVKIQTVTIPTSAWTSANPSTATVACAGMTADMTQDKFDVDSLLSAQKPVIAAAGLGNTDAVPGNGTIKLTCVGVVPTVELKIVVTIYG